MMGGGTAQGDLSAKEIEELEKDRKYQIKADQEHDLYIKDMKEREHYRIWQKSAY